MLLGHLLIQADTGIAGHIHIHETESRAATAFTRDDQPVSLLVTVAMTDDQPTAVLNRLSKLLLDK